MMCCVPRVACCAQCVPCVMATALRHESRMQEEGGEEWVECGQASCQRERNSTIKIYNNGQWLRCCCRPPAATCRCHDSCRYCLITPKWPRHTAGRNNALIKGKFKCGSHKCWLLISPCPIITTFFGQFNWSLISMRRQLAA